MNPLESFPKSEESRAQVKSASAEGKHRWIHEVHAHDPDSIARRLAQAPGQSYLKDFIYGGVDGAITTFAVVSGVWGAELSTRTVIILGLANLFADGFSMAVSNYLGSKAEYENAERFRNLERKHISLYPDGEREEIRQIFAQKGIVQPTLEEVVNSICSNNERWIETMLVEEYGVFTSFTLSI